MKRKILVLTLSMTMLLGMAMPVHAEEPGGYVMDANGNVFSLTPSEADKAAFRQALLEAAAAENPQKASGSFDPQYYAANNPDVVAAFGNEPWALYYHYSKYGYKENRLPYEGAAATNAELAKWDLSPAEVSEKMKAREAEQAGASASGHETVQAASTTAAQADGIVAIKDLANYSSLKKKMTDEEFQAAYNEALKIVQPLTGLSKEEQAKGIFNALRSMVDNGTVSYSEEAPHYNDAYGYLISHTASCAGSARTTGLCLNMLGMSYEHVNENQWSHQWCRVNINGVMWIVDPYGYVCAPETAPYAHPLL